MLAFYANSVASSPVVRGADRRPALAAESGDGEHHVQETGHKDESEEVKHPLKSRDRDFPRRHNGIQHRRQNRDLQVLLL